METEGVILVEKNIDAKHNQVIDIELHDAVYRDVRPDLEMIRRDVPRNLGIDPGQDVERI